MRLASGYGRRVTRSRAAVLAIVALAISGCGEKDEPSAGASGGGAAGGESDGERTLSGCLKLWEGPHVGSTRLQTLARTQTIFAKVSIKRDRCEVAFASRDGSIYGRYIEKENITGPWTKDAESAPAKVARRVVRSANARGETDGSLTPGAPQ